MSEKDDLWYVDALVVDDEAATRSLVRAMLQAFGVEQVDVAADGRAAMRCLAERIRANPEAEPYDLILCDWRMPEVTGLDLLKVVRRRFPDLPFVMLTAMRGPDEVRAAIEAGVTAYVAKPIVPSELKRKVVGVLGRAPAA